ncbi:MAG: nucleoside-diphosphate kinase [Firmicutes bacterium HGW-Firmicutes-12]|nr:MAG: nucleoside-diphosphate kinase [Firmicutes bacterium HGW-Firmicutes-12]
MERTFVMIKPDGVQRGLATRIMGAIEGKGYKLVALKMIKLSLDMAKKHYAEHIGKPFYNSLIEFITSGPVIAMVWQGPDVIKGIRNLMGSTNPLDAQPGSLRGNYGVDISHNLVHGSDSIESAKREIEIYFQSNELIEYPRDIEKWIW